MITQEDQRIFDRFTVRLPVKFKHSEEDFGTEVFLRDASAEGVKVTSRQRLFPNDIIFLMIKLPDAEHPLTLSGRVMWVQPKESNQWDAGLRFHKISLMSMQKLYKFAVG